MWDFPKGQAVVIGGSGGIGSQICRQMASAGNSVSFTYRGNLARANELLAELESLRLKPEQTFFAAALDIADTQQVLAFFELVAEKGPVHTVVNAAGSNIPMRYISDLETDLWRDVINADLNGFFNLVKGSLPLLRASRGSYVQISSIGLQRWPKRDVLSVAPKAAIESLLQGIASEEGRFGVRANAVQLGVIEAGLFLRLKDEVAKQDGFDENWVDVARGNTALKRFGTATDVANAVMYLASNQGGYVTGQSIKMDGGYSL